MEKFHTQNWLYQKRSLIKQELRPLRLEAAQRLYLKKLIKISREKIYALLILTVFAVLLEIAIPLLTNLYVKSYSVLLDRQHLLYCFVILLTILTLYGLISYHRIKLEKLYITRMLNTLRHDWYSWFLKRPLFEARSVQKSILLPKISYHFSLFQKGISSSLIPLSQWIFLTFGLLAVSFFISTRLLILIAVLIPMNFIIAFFGYFVSRFYISRDQTMYSKILRFISETLDEIPFLKKQQKEKEYIEKLDELVEIDTYFRVHRELWLKFGERVLFIMIALCGAIIYMLEIYYNFFEIEESGQLIVYGIMFGLAIKLLYLSLRIGLYLPPLQIGAVLSLPKFPTGTANGFKPLKTFKEICFHSKKVKISLKSYSKNVRFCFHKGERILFHGPDGTGKNLLERLFSGNLTNRLGKPWMIKSDGRGYSYNNWKSHPNNLILIYPEFHTEKTVLEMLLKKPLHEMENSDFEIILEKLNSYPVFDFIFQTGRVLNHEIRLSSFSFAQRAVLQMAQALFNPPEIVVISSLFLDLKHPLIDEMLEILPKELNNSVIICFSSSKQNSHHYDQIVHL